MPARREQRVSGDQRPIDARELRSAPEHVASGSVDVARSFEPLLARIGDAVKPVPGKVVVIGHTDNTQPGLSARAPSTWDLSKARAASVVRLLRERAGPPERYSIEGRGDTEPLVPNSSAANRARNRRVEIVVLTPAVAP